MKPWYIKTKQLQKKKGCEEVKRGRRYAVAEAVIEWASKRRA